MLELFHIGIDEKKLKFMLESNPNIQEMSEDEVNEHIQFLGDLGCQEFQIKNILIANPWYLDRIISDVVEMVEKLTELGLERIDLLVDSNPSLLNIDAFEIDDFVDRKMNEGYSMDDITDMIDQNSNVIVE